MKVRSRKFLLSILLCIALFAASVSFLGMSHSRLASETTGDCDHPLVRVVPQQARAVRASEGFSITLKAEIPGKNQECVPKAPEEEFIVKVDGPLMKAVSSHLSYLEVWPIVDMDGSLSEEDLLAVHALFIKALYVLEVASEKDAIYLSPTLTKFLQESPGSDSARVGATWDMNLAPNALACIMKRPKEPVDSVDKQLITLLTKSRQQKLDERQLVVLIVHASSNELVWTSEDSLFENLEAAKSESIPILLLNVTGDSRNMDDDTRRSLKDIGVKVYPFVLGDLPKRHELMIAQLQRDVDDMKPRYIIQVWTERLFDKPDNRILIGLSSRPDDSCCEEVPLILPEPQGGRGGWLRVVLAALIGLASAPFLYLILRILPAVPSPRKPQER